MDGIGNPAVVTGDPQGTAAGASAAPQAGHSARRRVTMARNSPRGTGPGEVGAVCEHDEPRSLTERQLRVIELYGSVERLVTRFLPRRPTPEFEWRSEEARRQETQGLLVSIRKLFCPSRPLSPVDSPPSSPPHLRHRHHHRRESRRTRHRKKPPVGVGYAWIARRGEIGPLLMRWGRRDGDDERRGRRVNQSLHGLNPGGLSGVSWNAGSGFDLSSMPDSRLAGNIVRFRESIGVGLSRCVTPLAT